MSPRDLPVSSACSLVRRGPHWPWEAVERGLRAIGLDLSPRPRRAPGSLVVTWNCYGAAAAEARAVRVAGGVHIVAENGYLARERGWVALGHGGVNGRDEIPRKIALSGGRRLADLGLSLRPWRHNPRGHVLVCGQRGGGYNDMAMRDDWPDEVLTRLLQLTKRKILYRPHPGRPRLPRRQYGRRVEVVGAAEPLEALLRDAFVCVVHTSNAATEALLEGVPVVYTGPTIALAACAGRGLHMVESPPRPDRAEAFDELANRQWHVEEIERGTAWLEILSRIACAKGSSRSSSPEAAAS